MRPSVVPLVLFSTLSMAICTNIAHAESMTIHISESGIEKRVNTEQRMPSPQNSVDFMPVESQSAGQITYINKDIKHKLDPQKNIQDANELGQSVEFEVYEISERHATKVVFESKAGVCYGFKSKSGVSLTDETTHYLKPSDKKDYYTNIIAATIYAKNDPTNVQYAPVVFIQEPDLAKQVQADNLKKSNQIATRHIAKNSNVLSDVICR